MKTYAEKLKDPRWQRKRLEIMERDGFKCRYCHSEKNTLNVHHRVYRKGKMPWDYEDDIFVTLCEVCHKEVEKRKESVLLAMGSNSRYDERMVSLAVAMEPRDVNLTFLGWAAENLADAIKNQSVLLSGGTPSASDDDIVHEIELNIFAVIRHMMEAREQSENASNGTGFESLIDSAPESMEVTQ